MNRTNSQFGFTMGLELSEDVLKVIAYHEGYGQRIRNIYATTAGNSDLLASLLNKMAAELQYNLTDPGIKLSMFQRAVTLLLLVQIGDIKHHNTVQHVADLTRNLRVILAHPMSSGDRKVVMFIKGQADSEKARLDSLVRERKLSLLAGLSEGSRLSGETTGESNGGNSKKNGEKEGGFWKDVGRRIRRSFGGTCGKAKE